MLLGQTYDLYHCENVFFAFYLTEFYGIPANLNSASLTS